MLSPLRTTCAAAVAFLALASPAKAWTWPASGPVLQAFRYGSDPYAPGQHRGIDVGGDAGAPVAAPRSGVVSFAGSLPTNGLSVTIETAEGFSVTLVHLGSIAVTRGGHVAEGQAVGAIGPSGTPEQDAPYVHLGIRTTSDANGYLDPLAFLPARTAKPAGEAPLPTSPTPVTAPKPHTTAAPAAPAPSQAPDAANAPDTAAQADPVPVDSPPTPDTPQPPEPAKAIAPVQARADVEGPSGLTIAGRPPRASVTGPVTRLRAVPIRSVPAPARTSKVEAVGSPPVHRGRSHPVGAYASGAAPCHVGLGCADDGPCACWAPAGVGGRGRSGSKDRRRRLARVRGDGRCSSRGPCAPAVVGADDPGTPHAGLRYSIAALAVGGCSLRPRGGTRDRRPPTPASGIGPSGHPRGDTYHFGRCAST